MKRRMQRTRARIGNATTFSRNRRLAIDKADNLRTPRAGKIQLSVTFRYFSSHLKER
jgi:hypothetical protein